MSGQIIGPIGVLPTGGGGTVSFDAFSSNTVATGGGTLSWTHTPVGTPTAVAVVLMNYDAGSVSAVTGVTYGGTAMALAVTQTISAGTSSVAIYGLASPLSGAQTVVITSSNIPNFTQGLAVTVTGSNLTTCFDSSNSATAAGGTTASVSVTSATGELIVDVVGNATGATETPGGLQTQRGSSLTSFTNVASASTLAAAAGSTGMSWTLGSSADWAHAAASFKKPTGGGGGSPTFLGTDAQVDDTLGGSVNSKTFTVNIGTASATRLMVFAIAMIAGGSPVTISSVTVNGSAPTSGPVGGDATHAAAIFYTTVATGTTATVVATGSTNITTCDIAVGVLDNLVSSTPGTSSSAFYATSQNAPYLMGNITVATGGFGLSFCWADSHSVIVSSNTTIDSVCHAEGTVTSIAMSHAGVGTINPSFGSGPGNFANVAVIGAPWA